MQIIIHAGANKAASSSLQSFWNLNIQRLIEFGIYYKKEIITKNRYFGGGNAGVLFAKNLNRGNLKLFFRKLIKEAKLNKCNTIFLSSEYIFSFSQKIENKKWFIEEISKYFDEIKLIYILRDLESHSFSTIRHRLLNHKIIKPFKWLIEDYEYPECIINLAKIREIYCKEINFQFIKYHNDLDPINITERILNLKNLNFDKKQKKFPKVNRNIPLNDLIFLLGLHISNNNIKHSIIENFDSEYRNLISTKEFSFNGLLYENQYNDDLLAKSIDQYCKRFLYIDYLIECLCENNYTNDLKRIDIYSFEINNMDNYQKKLLKEEFEFPNDLEFKSLLIEIFLKNYKNMIIEKFFINKFKFRRIFNSIVFRLNTLINKYF